MPHRKLLFLSSIVTTLMAGTIAQAADKVTYEDNILPLLRNSCLKCHNPDKIKGDLDLSTFGGVLKGGGSGAGVVSGDPDGSKLMKAITHAEEPNMPPNSPKMSDKEIDLIKRWIAGGLLETSGSKALAAAKPKVDLSVSNISVGKPDGPPPMPKDLLMEPYVHTGRTSVSTGLAGSPWAPLVALGGQKQVLLYNSDTLDLLGVLAYPEGYPSDLKFSRNAKLLLAGGGRGSKSGQVAVWDVTTGERIVTVGDEFDSVLASDISADQKLVALGGPTRLVKIIATKDGEVLHKMKKHTDWVTAVEFSPNGKYLASGDRNGGLVVWEADNGEEVYSFTGHKAAITALSWRGDSDLLASASEDGTVKWWKMSDGEQVKNLTAHNGGVMSAKFTHDGRLVTCGRDNQIAIWDATGNKARSIAYTNELPVRVSFTHDGGRVVASDYAGNVSVWNTADGKPVGDLQLNPDTLAERLTAAEKRITELEQEIAAMPGKVTAAEAEAARIKLDIEKAAKGSPVVKDLAKQLEAATKKVADLKAVADQSAGRLAQTKAAIEKMKVGQSYTPVYRAREEFASHKRQQESLKAEAEQAKAAGAKATQDLAAARKETAKTKDEKAALAKKIKTLTDLAKSSATKAASAKSAADKLAKDLVSEQAKLDKLSAEYERIKAAAIGTTKAAKL